MQTAINAVASIRRSEYVPNCQNHPWGAALAEGIYHFNGFEPVCTENSDSDVLVVQPTEERTRCNASGPLNRSGYRRILVQGTMCPRLIVVMRV